MSGNLHQAPAGSAQPLPKSAMAITGLVLGILAIVSSWIPILNNVSALIAVLGLIFGVVGIVGVVRGKKSGKGLAIAAIVLNVLAVVIVLATQSMYSAALDEAAKQTNPDVSSASEPSASAGSDQAEPDAQEADADYSSLTVGTVVDLQNGLSVSVDSVQTGLVNYDGSTMTGIAVTYVNNSDKEQSFNSYDWKGQDAQGALANQAYYSEAENELSSGSLAPGGTASGTVYFDGDIVKAAYYSNMFNDAPTAAWNLA